MAAKIAIAFNRLLLCDSRHADVLAGSLPPPSFPFPVKHVVIREDSPFNLQPKSTLGCGQNATNVNGMNRLGYLCQQVYNMFADEFSQFDSDYILLMDSDSLFKSFEWLRGIFKIV